MTSKPQSTTTAKPQPTLADIVGEALRSTEYNDVTGCVTINVVDALMAIANGINRLAGANEKLATLQEQAMAQSMAQSKASHQLMMSMVTSERPGHA